MKTLLAATAALIVGLASVQAVAITGEIHFANGVLQVDNIPATQITQIDGVTTSANAFAPHPTGTYLGVPIGTPVAFKGFDLDLSVQNIVDFWEFSALGSDFSFDLEKLTGASITPTGAVFDGVGTLYATGFDDTSGTFNLSLQNLDLDNWQPGDTFAFSAESAAVPDGGSSVALLGASLLGIGLLGRKKLS